MKKGFYLLVLFIILLAFLAASKVVYFEIKAAVAGLIIGFLNYIAGSAIVVWGFSKPDKQFYGSYYGGMIGRFFLLFFALFVMVKFFDFHLPTLIIFLMGSYFSFLVLEIWNIIKYSRIQES